MIASSTDTDLSLIEQSLHSNQDCALAFREARLLVDTCPLASEEREDLLESWRHLLAEASRPEPSAERLWRYWRRIDELSPPVAHRIAQSDLIRRESNAWWDQSIRPRGGFINERAAEEFVRCVSDPRIRDVLGMAYRAMLNLSAQRGRRPEGASDLLYFYEVIDAICRRDPDVLFQSLSPFNEWLEKERLRWADAWSPEF